MWDIIQFRIGIRFTILEKNDAVGGTWYENTYPDCGVDTPNHFYSFSFTLHCQKIVTNLELLPNLAGKN